MWKKLFYGVVGILSVLLLYLACVNEPDIKAKEVVKTYTNKEVAITFDDGPHASTTKKLLDGLKKRNVRASFFLVGENIEGNEETVKQMHEDGHLIGNHSYTHVQLTKLSKSDALSEINKTNEKIEEITGEKVKYIRPPCGDWNNDLLFETSLTPVLWSVDPLDWCTHNSGTVVNRVMKKVEDGDIILLHDLYDTSVTAAFEIVDRLLSQGYTFLTVDEIMIE